ncbi:hypothetical protein SIID45300_02097 [Candidatus Magnetaquicoccaceae bacterium FCR-1]|uniref:FimV N-terminal domain-containing protein n=1 Tax=Candidatus Magnetaquiglobus chichijimensis TaxID=3141448 RepID=A0ABQ0CA53_9PROT
MRRSVRRWLGSAWVGIIGLTWILCGMADEALALTMTGPMSVKSALNAPFSAEIPYTLEPGEPPLQVEVLVGTNSDFTSGGARSRLNARLVDEGAAGGRIVITGTQPENEPFFTLLLRVTQGNLSFVRNYPVALDAAASGVTPAFPVKGGKAAAGEPLPALSAIPSDQPTQTPAWRSAWLAWNRWINGLPRDVLAGIAGGLAFLFLVLLRWSRRRRAEAFQTVGEGSGRYERQEPVAVDAPPVFEPAPIAALAVAPFLVPEESPPEPGFAPDPMGELPATAPPEESLADHVVPPAPVSLEKTPLPETPAMLSLPVVSSPPVMTADPVEPTKRVPEPDTMEQAEPSVSGSPFDALSPVADPPFDVLSPVADPPFDVLSPVADPPFGALSPPELGAESLAGGSGQDFEAGLEAVLEESLSEWSAPSEPRDLAHGMETGESDLDLTELLMALESAPESHPAHDMLSGVAEEEFLSLEAVESGSGAVESGSGAVESGSGAVESRPGAVESRPGAVESRPGAVESRPGAVESRPGAVESRPGAVESRPGAVESRPGAVESGSGAVESRRRAMALDAADTGDAEAFLASLEVTGLDLVREPAFEGDPDWGVAGDLDGFGSLDAGEWGIDDGLTASEETLRAELDRAARESLVASPEQTRPLSKGEAMSAPSEAPRFEAMSAPSEAPRFEAMSAPSEAPRFEAMSAPSEAPRFEAMSAPSESPRFEAVSSPSESPRFEVVSAPSEPPRFEAVDEAPIPESPIAFVAPEVEVVADVAEATVERKPEPLVERLESADVAPEAWKIDPSASVATERSPFEHGAEGIEMIPFDFETVQADTTAARPSVGALEDHAPAWEFIPFELEEGAKKRELRITR